MRRALRTDRHEAVDPRGAGAAARLTVVGGGGATASAEARPGWAGSERPGTLILRLPVVPGRESAAPPVVAEATLQVKRFPGGRVEDERYRVELRASSTAPAALLAALAGAVARVEDLRHAGSPDEPFVLNIAIRG